MSRRNRTRDTPSATYWSKHWRGFSWHGRWYRCHHSLLTSYCTRSASSPPWGESMLGFDRALLLATTYRTVYGVAASYIVARLAPDRPMGHALGGRRRGPGGGEHSGCCGDMEQGPRLSGLLLVSTRARCARDAASLGERQTPRDAVAARADGASPSHHHTLPRIVSV